MRHSFIVKKPLALLLIGLLASPLHVALAASVPTPQIYHTKLPSGQQVYVQEIHTQPIVTIDTWVNVGSADETPQNNGVSHFLEHLLFKGTKTYKLGEIDRILESRGADFNAATSDDFTHYHITTASPYFEEALKLHADMLLNATINPPELTREREVVQEEINRSLDSPSRKAYIALDKLLFGNHPYAMDTLGPKSNIQKIPREAILDYYHTWYQPQNFKTIVVGDVQTEKAVKMVNQAFKTAYSVQVRPKPGLPSKKPILPINQPSSTVLTDPNVSIDNFELGFLAPGIEHRQDNFALDLAAKILGDGASSRLYRTLKEEQQLVESIGAGNITHRQAGSFVISAEIKPEKRAEAQKAILAQLAQFKAKGPTPEELEKAKTQVVKEFAFLNESTSGVANTIGYNVTIGSLSDYTDYVSNIQKITAADVKAAANKYLDFNKAAVVEILPKSDAIATHQEVAANIQRLRDAVHITATDTELAGQMESPAQNVQKVVLPNGTTLLMKQVPTSHTVAINIMAKGGRLLEPKPGVASMTAQVLMKGTKNRTFAQLSEELERQGLSLSSSSDEDFLEIRSSGLSSDVDSLMLILQDVLTNPTFPQDELEKERAESLQRIQTSRDQPSNLMFEKLTEALYPNHPYGAVGSRLEQSLPTLTRDDLVRFYQHSLRPDNLVISVVGRFDPERVKSGFQQILTAIPFQDQPQKVAATPLPKTPFPNVEPLAQDITVMAQKPEQAATWVAYGWHAPGISTDRDYITLKVINTLLGSGLSSRLFVNLREKQGLAYHVSSTFPSMLKTGNFVMYIGTDPKNLPKVEEGFQKEISRLQTESVSSEELEAVKSKLIGSFALAHESNANQAFYQGFYETMGVGYGFDHQYPKLVEQVTSEDVQRVAQQIFSQPKVVTVVAPKAVRKETAHDDTH